MAFCGTVGVRGGERREVKKRENWLSPVSQAPWEARTVGWLEKEELLPPGTVEAITVCDRMKAPLGPPAMGRSTEEVKLPSMTRVYGQVACCDNRSWSSSPRHLQCQLDPVLTTVLY